jgi:hypothetical protein
MSMILLTQARVILNMTIPAALFVYKDNLQPTPHLIVPHRDNTGESCMTFICLTLILSPIVLSQFCKSPECFSSMPIFIAQYCRIYPTEGKVVARQERFHGDEVTTITLAMYLPPTEHVVAR